MGRDERASRLDIVRQMAEIERAAGPTRAFGSIKECPKCLFQNDNIAYDWCIGHNHLDDNPRQCPMDGEHNHRLCPRCKYGWFERCADYVEDADPPRIVSE